MQCTNGNTPAVARSFLCAARCNAPTAAAAGRGAGAAKNRIEAARLAQNQPQGIHQLSPAHASAPGAGGGSAPLVHAPSGASGASAPLVHAPAPSARGRQQGAGGGAGGAGGVGPDYKVTGTDIFSRPDDSSVWDNGVRAWLRRRLPGEREAEVISRTGAAKNALEREMFDYRLTRQQQAELSAINDALEEARASGRFSPDEMAELERQATARRLGIKPLPVPKPDAEAAQAAFDRRLVTAGGRQGYIGAKGDFIPFEDGDGGFGEFMKLYPKLATYETTETVKDSSGMEIQTPVTRQRTPEEAANLYRQLRQAFAQTAQEGDENAAPPGGSLDPMIATRLALGAPLSGLPDESVAPAPPAVGFDPVTALALGAPYAQTLRRTDSEPAQKQAAPPGGGQPQTQPQQSAFEKKWGRRLRRD